jgi:hypothetical protein
MLAGPLGKTVLNMDVRRIFSPGGGGAVRPIYAEKSPKYPKNN